MEQEYCYHLRRLFKVTTYNNIPLKNFFHIYLNLKTILHLIKSFNLKHDEYKYGMEYTIKDGLVFSLKLWGLGIKKLSEISQLKYLTNLEFLDVSGNEINVIDGLEQFMQLKSLKFGDNVKSIGNKISEIRGLDNLINLEILDLSHNEVREINGLQNLKKLKFLSLADNQIKEIKKLDNLQAIEILIFENNLVSDANFNEILSNLQELNLNNNQLKEIELGNLLGLEIIVLTFNPLLKISGLKNLSKLVEIILNRDQILRIKGLEELKGFKIRVETEGKSLIPWDFQVETIEKYKILIKQNKKKKI
jgi:hypothetical protein